VSIYVVINNWYSNKRNLKIENLKCTKILNDETPTIEVECYIQNNSKNNILIDDAYLKFKNGYHSIRDEVFFGAIGVTMCGKNYIVHEKKSNKLPIRLAPYDSLNALFVIPIVNATEIEKEAHIIFQTSRGTIEKTVPLEISKTTKLS